MKKVVRNFLDNNYINNEFYENYYTHIVEYCVIDAVSCFNLWKKNNILEETLEMCSLTFVDLLSGFYRANGFKISNLVSKIAEDNNISLSLVTTSTKKYEKFPRKTNKKKADVTEEAEKEVDIIDDQIIDEIFSKNTSGRTEKRDAEIDEELGEIVEKPKKRGKKISIIPKIKKEELSDEEVDIATTVKIPGGRVKSPLETGILNYALGVLDFQSMYPSIIIAFNMSPELVVYASDPSFDIQSKKYNSYEVQFETFHGVIIRNHREGLFPSILTHIFKKRLIIKELMKNEQDPYKKIILNCKQNAAKVFMNTFYGQTASPISPLSCPLIAGGITTTGVKLITMAEKFMEENGCLVNYIDTDSLFIRMAGREIDKKDVSKLEENTRLHVQETFKVISHLTERVNKLIQEFAMSTQLKLMFEDVFCPILFISKKKYCGVAHETIDKIDFKKKETVKGIEIKKRGNAGILVELGNQVIHTALNVTNTSPIKEIVTKIIHAYFNNDYPPELFVKASIYRKEKQNLRMNYFIENEKKKHNHVEYHDGDKIKFVYVKMNNILTEVGTKRKIKASDQMMSYDEFISPHNVAKIDKKRYFEGSLQGMFCGFLGYNQELSNAENIKENKKKINEFLNATIFLEENKEFIKEKKKRMDEAKPIKKEFLARIDKKIIFFMRNKSINEYEKLIKFINEQSETNEISTELNNKIDHYDKMRKNISVTLDNILHNNFYDLGKGVSLNISNFISKQLELSNNMQIMVQNVISLYEIIFKSILYNKLYKVAINSIKAI